jgi:oxaloacetate decarboxylase alpha subunit
MEKDKGLQFGENIDDDVLTYALFPQPAIKFLAHRGDPSAFEPAPEEPLENPVRPTVIAGPADSDVFTVEVEGKAYVVSVSKGGEITSAGPVAGNPKPKRKATGRSLDITAPMSGNIFKLVVAAGDQVESGDVVLILEAMKMETEIRAGSGGRVTAIPVEEGDAVAAGDTLMSLE